ncbi:MAG: hypothetical protein WAK21_16365, partial [Candidatus Sulfotelmatobacter sp.]
VEEVPVPTKRRTDGLLVCAASDSAGAADAGVTAGVPQAVSEISKTEPETMIKPHLTLLGGVSKDMETPFGFGLKCLADALDGHCYSALIEARDKDERTSLD